jgi:5-(carboxyamino)imidazole ribonucleotide synthase
MSRYFSSDFMLGILGGGQLGKMLLQDLSRMDIRTAVLDPSSFSPCKGRAEVFEVGDLKDFETVYRFGKLVNTLTIEIEHVNVAALERLEKEGIKVHPKPTTLRIIQDKRLQKQFFSPTNPKPISKSTPSTSLASRNQPCRAMMARV